MTQDSSRRTWGYGVAIAALALALVVLGALNVWRWLETRRSAVESTVSSADPLSTGRTEPPSDPGDADARTPPAGSQAPGDAAQRGPGGFAAEERAGAQPGDASPRPAAGSPPEAARSPGAASPPGGPATDSPIVPQPLPAEAGAAARRSPEAAAPAPESRAPEEEKSAGDDASDRTGPVLGHLRFEPGMVEGGGATTLTILASDNLSGVKSARGEIQSPSGQAVLPLWLQESADGRSFTYVVNIPASAETGVWFVKWLHLTDVANNSSLIQAASASLAPPGGTFSVSSAESDSTAPDVVEVSFEKDLIEDEARNEIRVEVHDDLSGVASVSGACRTASGSALIPFHCALNPESGLWEGTITIPECADCGTWSVQQLSVKDKAGNTTHLTAESRSLGHAGFAVARGSECDSSPPTLQGLVLSPTIVSGDAATEVLISAVIRDDGCGATSMTGWFEGPVSEGGQVTRSDFTCTPDPENPDAPWTGKVLVPRFSAKGSWKVREIELKDKAMNVREYTPGDPAISAGVFEVR